MTFLATHYLLNAQEGGCNCLKTHYFVKHWKFKIFILILSVGPFQSQKKNLFHKIVSKYKHKKEKPNVPEKGIDAFHPPLRVLVAAIANSSLSDASVHCLGLFLACACFSAISCWCEQFHPFWTLQLIANPLHLDATQTHTYWEFHLSPIMAFHLHFHAFYNLIFWSFYAFIFLSYSCFSHVLQPFISWLHFSIPWNLTSFTFMWNLQHSVLPFTLGGSYGLFCSVLSCNSPLFYQSLYLVGWTLLPPSLVTLLAFSVGTRIVCTLPLLFCEHLLLGSWWALEHLWSSP